MTEQLQWLEFASRASGALRGDRRPPDRADHR
jgi:hypothetical protein